ncbi:MaoC/PaaZ C-terminal domain-containing protein [Streptomyces sp. NHF165]|uniref:MaoC/PaaZ C-terminal domain-containing protein n=1 Tax=Streptomyces sp. NHF165 TaxID=2175864 RepID=UPI001916EC3D|nr:MaoC/PaaZ C-terminal domain-containing protein [Streptomyces sp. NHF165]
MTAPARTGSGPATASAAATAAAPAPAGGIGPAAGPAPADGVPAAGAAGPASAPATGPVTGTPHLLDAAAVTAYRAAVRAGAPAARTADVSPVHAFVLAHALADETVRALAAGEPEPPTVVHLAQEIRLARPVRPGETLVPTLEVAGARREPQGTRVAVRTRLTGDDGRDTAPVGDDAAAVAELTTTALLQGATGVAPFGSLPPAAPPPASGEKGEPSVVTRELTAEQVRAYAHAAGDLNPIHLDPAAARAAGFETVLVHGMHVIALACEEIADRYADGDIARITAVGGRFSAPVHPGVPVELTLQPDGGPGAPRAVRFSCRTPAGPAVKSGWVELAPEGGGRDA